MSISVFAEDDLLCEKSLELATSNKASSFLDPSLDMSPIGREAFETYSKNSKFFSSKLFAIAIAIEFKGTGWISRNEILKRVRILPSLTNASSSKTIARRIALNFIQLINDDFGIQDTKEFDKLAKELGVDHKELNRLLTIWREDSANDPRLEKMTAMIEYLLINEADLLETRIRGITFNDLYLTSHRKVINTTNHFEAMFNRTPFLSDERVYSSRYLLNRFKARAPSKIRVLLNYLGLNNERFLSTSHSQEIFNPALYKMFQISNEKGVSLDYKVIKFLDLLREYPKLLSIGEVELILTHIKDHFVGRCYGEAKEFFKAMQDMRMNHSNMFGDKIPNQFEIFYLILNNLDNHSVDSSEQIWAVKSNVMELSRQILKKFISWSGDYIRTESRVDIIEFMEWFATKTAQNVADRLIERSPLNGFSKASDSLNSAMLELKQVAGAWVPPEEGTVTKPGMRRYTIGDLEFLLPDEDYIPISKTKVNAVVASDYIVIDGKRYQFSTSYSFEELADSLKAALEEKNKIKKFASDSLENSIWAFLYLESAKVELFSADAQFVVELVN